MTSIVQDLLELSRLESSDTDAAGQPIDVVALMAQLRQDVLARPQHPAQVQVRADSHAMLLGEELQIHSAFANLVDNAAKYTPADGSVQIRWWTDDRGGHFSVADTGIGIAPRAHSATDRAVLPRRCRPQPRHRRLRTRTGDRQARAAAAWRAAVDRERGGARQQLHLSLSPRAAADPAQGVAWSSGPRGLRRDCNFSKLRSASRAQGWDCAILHNHALSPRCEAGTSRPPWKPLTLPPHLDDASTRISSGCAAKCWRWAASSRSSSVAA